MDATNKPLTYGDLELALQQERSQKAVLLAELVQEIISDEEIERVHANANFGSMSKREVVNQGILKCAAGYYQGHTSTMILRKHGLITPDYKLTAKGRHYLWVAFSGGSNF